MKHFYKNHSKSSSFVPRLSMTHPLFPSRVKNGVSVRGGIEYLWRRYWRWDPSGAWCERCARMPRHAPASRWRADGRSGRAGVWSHSPVGNKEVVTNFCQIDNSYIPAKLCYTHFCAKYAICENKQNLFVWFLFQETQRFQNKVVHLELQQILARLHL